MPKHEEVDTRTEEVEAKIEILWQEFLAGDPTPAARDEYKAKVAVLLSALR